MDERFQRAGIDFRLVRLPRWKLWLLAGLGGTIVLVLALTVAGLFLILFPLVLIAGFVARLVLGGGRRVRPRPDHQRPPQQNQPEVLEGHYEVVEVRQGRGWDRRPRA